MPKTTRKRWGIALVATLGLTIVVGAWTLARLEHSYRGQLEERLLANALSAAEMVRQWQGLRLAEVSRWAGQAEVRRHAEALLAAERSKDALLAHPSQQALRDLLGPILGEDGYHGLFVIAPDGTTLASMRDDDLGTQTLLRREPDLVDRLLGGQPIMTPPRETDESPTPFGSEHAPTMFVGAAIRGESGNILAILTFRIAPREQLDPLLALTRMGRTGETYAIDREGRLMTSSRFEATLRAQGRPASARPSTFPFRLRDEPSGATPRPFAALLRHETGVTSDPYPGYLDRPVVGAWAVTPSLGLGVLSEQDADEALGPLHQLRALVAGALVLIALAGLGLALHQRASARALSSSQAVLHQAAEAARSSALRLSEAQQLSRTASGVLNVQSGDIEWHAGARSVLGPDLPRRLRDLKALTQRFAERDRDRFEQSLAALLRAEGSTKLELSMESGTATRTLQLRMRSVDDASAEAEGALGRPTRLLITAQDVSEQRAMEAAAKELRERLHTSARLESAGRLAASVAHDFNNLLTIILGNAEHIAHASRRSPPQQYAIEILQAGWRAADLTGQMLSLAGGPSSERAATPVNEAIHELSDLLVRALGDDVRLVLDLDPGAGSVIARRTDIDQIVMNLVVNARDALPSGGTISVVTRVLRDEQSLGDRSGDSVEIVVRDDGIGMDVGTLERVFEPFFTTKGRKGTGLGLATVRDVTDRCSGKVHAQSILGRGTSVHVRLWRQASAAPRGLPEASAPRAPASHVRVMLVEDEASLSHLLSRTLEAYGYHVRTFWTPAEALCELEVEHDGGYDLLITDLDEPTGRTFLEQVRARCPELKALFMVSQHTPRDDDPELPPDSAILSKPFSVESLLQEAHALLDAEQRSLRTG